MKIFVAGATGFIGKNLVKKLLEEDMKSFVMLETLKKQEKYYGPDVELLQTTAFDNHIIKSMERCDAVINLAGEPIIKRWTKKNKQKYIIVRIDLQKTC